MPSLPEKSKVASGAAPISQAVNFVVTTVTVGKGRYTIRGSGRHSLADGLKISVGQVGLLTDLATIPNAANAVATFPLITFDALTSDTVVQVRLAVATGGADTASAVLSCQLEQPI